MPYPAWRTLAARSINYPQEVYKSINYTYCAYAGWRLRWSGGSSFRFT